MGVENPIRTLRDYFKPCHHGYMNTIELPVGNNVVPLRSDTIRLVQNRCSFYGLWSKDPNQHIKDFLKLVDSLDFDGENKERMIHHRMEDLTTRFLAQFFSPGRTAKLRNDIMMFQQHHDVSLRFVPRCMAWLNYDEHADSLNTMDNEVGVTSPESTIQTLLLFEEYTPPVTYPEEVNKTLGTSIEVEPLNETKLEEGVYSYYNSGIDDPKRHYGFKPGLLGKSVSLGLDISNWEMFDDDWRLESKEVSPLIEELSLIDRPNEVEKGIILKAHRLESILQQ
nr:zinc finger, CCHC-type [Tanacetum cinerariifolium]